MRVRVDSNRRPIPPAASSSSSTSISATVSATPVVSTASSSGSAAGAAAVSSTAAAAPAHVAATPSAPTQQQPSNPQRPAPRPPRPPSTNNDLTLPPTQSARSRPPLHHPTPVPAAAAPSLPISTSAVNFSPPVVAKPRVPSPPSPPSPVAHRPTVGPSSSSFPQSTAAAAAAAGSASVSTAPTSCSSSTPVVTADDERGSDSGSSAATEAYNSEDEHPGPSSSDRAQVEMPVRTLREREAHFSSLLAGRNLRIMEMRPDGNCLFRALAHVVWNDAEHHQTLRARIMQYLVQERDYFSQFVAEDFMRYVRRKSRDGTHGNHLELQAAAELFGRPIEVFSYGDTPDTIVDPFANTAEPDAAPVEPIRLSFHRGSHYNAVVPISPPLDKHAKPARPTPAQSAANDWRFTADARATENEMERVVMALSLVEATRGESAAGSSSSASTAAMVPSVVLALVNLGYPEEQANEAYRVAGQEGLPAMVRYITSNLARYRPRGASSSHWDSRPVAAGAVAAASTVNANATVPAPSPLSAQSSQDNASRLETKASGASVQATVPRACEAEGGEGRAASSCGGVNSGDRVSL